MKNITIFKTYFFTVVAILAATISLTTVITVAHKNENQIALILSIISAIIYLVGASMSFYLAKSGDRWAIKSIPILCITMSVSTPILCLAAWLL
jgi:hypothetical protein